MNFPKNVRIFGAKTFFFRDHFRDVSLVLGLEHFCHWPREGLPSVGLSLALDYFCVLGLGLEPCVLDSTSTHHRLLLALVILS